MAERSCGILLHITSLPGDEGIGTLGENAFRFVDFLAETKQKLWQILPLGPVCFGDSPYQCYSAFAGNIQLIDLDLLVEEGLLDKTALKKRPRFNRKQVDFTGVANWKVPLLQKAFKVFQTNIDELRQNDYNAFLDEHSWWLQDFALFMSAKNHFKGEVWTKWPKKLKFRKPDAIQKYHNELKEEIEYWKFVQFLFFRQWFRLKDYANSKGIQIIGDVPLYVSTDSADVWTNTDIFLLDEDLNPTEVGGVPPDYFSETGQLWGNPVFNWQRLKERNFDWWLARLYFNRHMFNLVRIDHFRGLESYWSIPAGEKTAINGKWVPAMGYELLAKFKEQFGSLPFIAEDLGLITPEVDDFRNHFNLPGMKVIQFAFTSDEASEHLPHNFDSNFVAYTGTHDNDTTLGWLGSVKNEEKKQVERYFAKRDRKALVKTLEMTWSSRAKMAIVPLQDILELNSKARMNIPGTAFGNWGWRFRWKQLKLKQRRFLKELTVKYNR